MTASTPGFWRPIELSIPPGVSVTRGVGLPILGFSVVPLQQIPPSRSTSTTSPYSTPYPNVPDATRIGFGRTSPRPRSTERSTDSAATRAGGSLRPVPPRTAVADDDEGRPVPADTGRFGGDGYFCSATLGDAVTARRLAFTGRTSCSVLGDPQPRVPSTQVDDPGVDERARHQCPPMGSERQDVGDHPAVREHLGGRA